jgi:predicted HTH domain antitoxin
MPLTIPDETLAAARMTEQELRVEIACRLFEADKLSLWPAAQLAGMSRDDFIDALHQRGIGWPRLDVEDFEQDAKAIDKLFGAKERV